MQLFVKWRIRNCAVIPTQETVYLRKVFFLVPAVVYTLHPFILVADSRLLGENSRYIFLLGLQKTPLDNSACNTGTHILCVNSHCRAATSGRCSNTPSRTGTPSTRTASSCRSQVGIVQSFQRLCNLYVLGTESHWVLLGLVKYRVVLVRTLRPAQCTITSPGELLSLNLTGFRKTSGCYFPFLLRADIFFASFLALSAWFHTQAQFRSFHIQNKCVVNKV